jgi:hypothetical protein
VATATLVLCNAAVAQSEPKSRVDYFLEQADQVTITLSRPGAEPVKLQRQEQPAYLFANSSAPDKPWGAIVLWLDDDMPVVASSFYMRWKAKQLFREFASLADAPLQATCDGQMVWAPESGCFARRALPEAMPPSEDERVRKSQMLRAAERFHSQGLRLMATPLYRYSSKKYGVIDGAIFALVGTHDPDVLVLLEAVKQDGGTMAWRYAIGRMRSDVMQVQLDDTEICAFDSYWAKPDLTLPYVEQFDGNLPEEILRPAR